MENKKIIGYKLIKPEYEAAVIKILNNDWWSMHANNNLKSIGYNFASFEKGNKYAIGAILETAGVLDIWFTPVFELGKPKKVVVELSNGKSVTVKKEYVLAESKRIDIEHIKNLLIEIKII